MRHLIRPAVLSLLATALACASPVPIPVAPDDPRAETLRRPPAGPVIGTGGRYGGDAWLGIPYARPPVGPLRWRAPQPPEPWQSRGRPPRFGAWCPQFATPMAGAVDRPPGTRVGAEDCLTLNVWAPSGRPDVAPRHGLDPRRRNVVGSAALYDGSRLASEHEVVVVGVNHRLGALGWFRHPKLNADRDAVERSGNFGTLDLVRALEWVRDNVAAFGGDPGRVTVFGESAGGHNVLSLLVAPRARGLFHGAIVQSGGTWNATVAEAENLRDAAEPGAARSGSEVLLLRLVAEGRAADRDGARAVADAMSPTRSPRSCATRRSTPCSPITRRARTKTRPRPRNGRRRA